MEASVIPSDLYPSHRCKTLHLVRHAQGTHNVASEKNHDALLSYDLFDAQLSSLGWEQVDNLREYVQTSGLSNRVELVIVSPLLRSLQTAAGVFGSEAHKENVKAPPLMVANTGNSDRSEISSLNSPPFLAIELCRERLDCIGAMDGTHVPCIVDADLQNAFRNRKGFTSQNVLAIVDFDMKFTYVVAGWEGSVHDARVLRDAQCDQSFRFPHPPAGKYYLVDSGYPNRLGYLAPYRGTNYHLRDRRRQGGDPKKERFNYRHSSLRNVVERTFGIWKSRFQILRGIPHYTVRMQRDIIIACAVLHNFIKMFADDADLFNNGGEQEEDGGDDQYVDPSTQQQNVEAIAMGDLRDYIRDTIWDADH